MPLSALALAVSALGLILEVLLRFLPVLDYTYPMPVNEQNPVARNLPNRNLTYSAGWRLENHNKVRVNNDGFINDQDYYEHALLPLVAVVGDSYIEALMVPFAQTLQGRLADTLRAKLRVYSFGFSGAPLSQYLVWARYASEKYKNDFLIINVVANDFNESLLKYKNRAGASYYAPDDNGNLRLTRLDYTSTRYRLAFKSALVRYLLLNLGVAEIRQRIHAFWAAPSDYVGNTLAVVSADVIEDSTRAIDAFFRDLPTYSGLPKQRVLLLVDAMRPQIYDPIALRDAETSYYGQMRREFISKGLSAGYAVVDLQPMFIEHFARESQRFEYPNDGHWNPIGHGVAATAVAQSSVFKDFQIDIGS
ncbi:MAG: hypothetical protein FJ145_21920 [Deltaproteobacteria bacterium]|nr:hypothetical protein [Deltaproteobacteria bacterium]